MMGTKLLAVAAFVFSFGSVGANAMPVELVSNGGFETGNLTGWSCISSDICSTNNSFADPNTGTWSVFAYDNQGVGTLSQTIATVLGQSYDFSFFSYSNANNAANILDYQIGSSALVSVPLTLAHAQTSTSFIANGASTVLNFFFETDSGTGGWIIDDVSVTGAAASVPTPATLALFGLGLVGIGWSKRKKV